MEEGERSSAFVKGEEYEVPTKLGKFLVYLKKAIVIDKDTKESDKDRLETAKKQAKEEAKNAEADQRQSLTTAAGSTDAAVLEKLEEISGNLEIVVEENSKLREEVEQLRKDLDEATAPEDDKKSGGKGGGK